MEVALAGLKLVLWGEGIAFGASFDGLERVQIPEME